MSTLKACVRRSSLDKRRATLGLALAACLLVLGLGPVTGSAQADASGPDLIENFTMTGNWSCTTNCGTTSGSWGISGSSATCFETEVEGIVPGAVPCSGKATFTGSIDRRCTISVCTEQGTVSFSLPDSAEGTYVVPVDVHGSTPSAWVGVSGQQVGATAQAMTLSDAERVVNGDIWDAGGTLQWACAGTNQCTASLPFAVTLTKR